MSVQETNNKKLLVFLSHANEDKPAVRRLYKRLLKDGFDPWLDEERLLPGQNWELEIEKALKASDAVLICCSKKSIEKEGVIQKEFKRAMYYQERKPEGEIFVIPVRLDNCELPFFLYELHWVDFPTSYHRLVLALNSQVNKLSSRYRQKEDLYNQNAIKESSTVQFIIDNNFKDFNKNSEEKLINFLVELLNVNKDDIRILKVSEGSVIVECEMSNVAVSRLAQFATANDTRLIEKDIIAISINGVDRINLSKKSREKMIPSSSKVQETTSKSTRKRIRIAILDNHQAIIDGYLFRLDSEPDIDVVFSAHYWVELELILEQKPIDILILDVNVPTSIDDKVPYSILQTIPRLLQKYPELNILVITMYAERGLVHAVMETGASGYILKSDQLTLRDLANVMRSVAMGGIYMSDEVYQLYNKFQLSDPELTVRQLEALSLCAAYPYSTTTELAQKMNISNSTFRNLLSAIYVKLRVNTRSAAVSRAQLLGKLSSE